MPTSRLPHDEQIDALREILSHNTVPLPVPGGAAGDGAAAARQFDAALMSVGFKASGPLLERLSQLEPSVVIDTAGGGLAAVGELVGDHVQHNVYFRDVPRNVPATVDFWLERLAAAFAEHGP